MAASAVQTAGNHTDSDTTNVGITATFGVNTTAGNILVVAGFAVSASGLSVSDTSADTFTRVFQGWGGSGSNLLQIWVSNPIAGGNTGGVNVQKSAGGTNVQVIAIECSGIDIDVPTDLNQSTGNSGAGVPSVGPFSTHYDGELAIVFSGQSPVAAPTTQTAGGSFINLNNQASASSELSSETLVLGNADAIAGTSTTGLFGTSVTNSGTVLLTLIPSGHKLFKSMAFGYRSTRPHIFQPGLAR